MSKETKNEKAAKDEKAEQDEKADKGVRWVVQDEGVNSVYCNHTQMLLGPFDITLRLGQLGFFESPEGMGAKELVRVFMSPQHMKALRDLFVRQVALYESRFGLIPDITAHIEELAAQLAADAAGIES